MANYLYSNSGTPTVAESVTVSSGASDADKIVSVDASGKLDLSVIPTLPILDTKDLVASEALVAGDYVNIWDSSGAKIRKADATTVGKEAHGYVLAPVASSATGKVYFKGINNAVTGQVPGNVFLSTTPGTGSNVAPATIGNVAQKVGVAVSATEVVFHPQLPVEIV